MVTTNQTHKEVLGALQSEEFTVQSPSSEGNQEGKGAPNVDPSTDAADEHPASGEPRRPVIADAVGSSEWEEIFREHYQLLTDLVGRTAPAFKPTPEQLDTLARLWGRVLDKRLGEMHVEYMMDIVAASYTATLLGGQYVQHLQEQKTTRSSKPTNQEETSNAEKGAAANQNKSESDFAPRYPNLDGG